MIYTVFPNDTERMPQDFPTYAKVQAYGEAEESEQGYTIESTTGECV